MNKLLIVVDYQVDFVDGLLPCGEDGIAILPAIRAKIEAYRKSGGSVLFTFDTHRPEDYRGSVESALFPPHCMAGTPGHALYGGIEAGEGETLFKSTFGSLDLPGHPLVAAADAIELAGVATNVCVLHSAVILWNACPDKKLLLDPRCCASFDRKLHDEAIDIMRAFGVEII